MRLDHIHLFSEFSSHRDVRSLDDIKSLWFFLRRTMTALSNVTLRQQAWQRKQIDANSFTNTRSLIILNAPVKRWYSAVFDIFWQKLYAPVMLKMIREKRSEKQTALCDLSPYRWKNRVSRPWFFFSSPLQRETKSTLRLSRELFAGLCGCDEQV